MGQAETREMIQRAIQRGDSRIRVVNGEEEDEEDEEYMLESEDDYDDADEEVGYSSPSPSLTENYYKAHGEWWPIEFKSAPNNKEIHLTQANLQLGEQLLSAFQTDTDPSQQEQQLATASRLFYACLTDMQFRTSSIASHFRILSQVGLLITFFKQLQLTTEGNEAKEKEIPGEEELGYKSELKSKVQRLDDVIIDLSREPGLSWYFSQQTPHPSIVLQLYSHLWARLHPTSPPLLIPLLTEVLESEYKIPTLDSSSSASASSSSSNTVLSRLQDEIDRRFWLLRSGAFGGSPTALSHSNTFSPSSNVHNLLRGREIRNYGFSPRLKMTAAQTFIPHSKSRSVIGRFGPLAGYCGQFSRDGSLFYGAWKDWTIRLFDTSQLSSYNASANHFKLRKTIHTEEGNWTITDCQLSSDNRFLIYSSIIPQVYLCRLDEDRAHQQLEFARPNQHFFGIWSIRLSADNREVVCGTNRNTIGVYDLEADRLSFDARAHDDDVNAVCFLEEGNSHVFASASDDTFIKIWDRRTINASNGKASGVLSGHTEGITYISPKGDGRYLVSNSKDQTMKLWDIRKMETSGRAPKRYRWDYRGMDYPGNPFRDKHSNDQSLVTCIGHTVLRTLIRSHFSPSATTGQRYLYSGSADGHIYVYDLSGTLVSRLKVSPETVVRDVSWHPHHPVMVATSWNGTLTSFSYSGSEENGNKDATMVL